jgi:oxalate decarboxylase/phosphoglucose isomerase-like protein (cupin superfamily)
MKTLLFASILCVAQIAMAAPVLTFQADPTIVSDLITANGQAERVKMLNDSQFVFDFFNPVPGSISSNGPNGHITSAKLDTFPVLVGEGVAMSVGFLGPCGLNTPHIHPRATEFNFAVNGTLRTGMIQENGVRVVTNDIGPGQATIFPRGSIHFEQNVGCEPMIFIAAFSSEDPGTTSIANNFFRLASDVVQATLGGHNLTDEVELLPKMIPESVAFGIQECLQRCGINVTQPDSKSSTVATSGGTVFGRHATMSVTMSMALLCAVTIWVLC